MRTNVMTVVEDLLLYLLHFCSGVSLTVLVAGVGLEPTVFGLWGQRVIPSPPSRIIFVDPTGIEPVTFTLWVYCYYHWAKDHCVPGRNPTSNLRLRRPLLYAVELQGHLFGVPTRAWTGNPHIKSVVLYHLSYEDMMSLARSFLASLYLTYSQKCTHNKFKF